MKNNSELVDCVQLFETAWENGKLYLSSNKDINMLVAFGQIVEELKRK